MMEEGLKRNHTREFKLLYPTSQGVIRDPHLLGALRDGLSEERTTGRTASRLAPADTVALPLAPKPPSEDLSSSMF
jgi:hypothetical protein